jgi:transketolase
MGRSKLPVIADAAGEARFGDGYEFVYGRADWLWDGDEMTIITCGTMVHRALEAAGRLAEQGLGCGVLNVSCPLALDEAALERAARTGPVVTYEDHHVRTGLGALAGAWLLERGLHCRFRRLGVTHWGKSGAPEDLYREQGLAVEDLVAACWQLREEADE